MSGPCDPSDGRAEKANQPPSGEYAAASPTTITSLAIAFVPGDALIGAVGEADGATLTDGAVVGLAGGVAVPLAGSVVLALVLGVGVPRGVGRSTGVGLGASDTLG